MSAGSTTGARWRSELRTNAAVRRPASRNEPRTRGLLQPQSLPLMMPRFSSARAPASSSAPGMSGMTRRPGARLSTTVRRVATMASTPNGRLIRNAQRQPPSSTRAPPIGGPSPAATAAVAPHRPMACARRSLVNASITMASEAGTSIAAPSAWTTRPATRSSRVGAAAHHSDASVKRAMPPTYGTPPPDQVREPPAHHQERREHDVVGVEHPRQRGDRRLGERLPDRRERDVHDGRVEERQERTEARDQQDSGRCDPTGDVLGHRFSSLRDVRRVDTLSRADPRRKRALACLHGQSRPHRPRGRPGRTRVRALGADQGARGQLGAQPALAPGGQVRRHRARLRPGQGARCPGRRPAGARRARPPRRRRAHGPTGRARVRPVQPRAPRRRPPGHRRRDLRGPRRATG